MKRFFWSLLAMGALTSVAAAQEPVNKFRIRAGQLLKGTEEYRVEKTREGYLLSGKSNLEVRGAPQQLTHELVLAPDRSLVSYKLEVRTGSGLAQIISAQRDGEKISLQAKAGPQNPSKIVDFRPGIVVLDNVIAAHFQGLLDWLPAKTEARDVELLVPQAFAVLKGRLQELPQEQATLDGRRIMTRRYRLEVGGLLTEIWAESAGNRLMRAYVPLQDAEVVREGFALASKEEPKGGAAAYRERDLTFPSGELRVPGTLCLPLQASGRVPAVVLVHGSGPHDRDETVGPNKPFLDLAHGLAAEGIATLRYEKRTFAFRGKLGPKLTVEEEVIADAVAALAYACALPEVDAGRVFLLGHSLGGSMAPFIVARAPETRGAVLLAAAARPLDELTYEQVAFQAQATGQDQATVSREIEQLKKEFARVRSGEAADSEVIFGASAYYWRDLLRRDIIAQWKKLNLPVLVLQGGQDVQVRRTDYEALLGVLGPRGEGHFLPKLNHLFMPVEGKATGAEYGIAGRVDPEVIQIIARWIRK